ncbi:hypothetical protein B0H17DRAFT_1127188 [Mycena rosella]|uniref:Uncharacterized protein n=1 Tax=Mycena rosella TaxID=1033263 RepID=A0AAD7E234_MYCRO|nr:hypothetical protein B0H17DRAFT_1127188 [Mycena rosella]
MSHADGFPTFPSFNTTFSSQSKIFIGHNAGLPLGPVLRAIGGKLQGVQFAEIEQLNVKPSCKYLAHRFEVLAGLNQIEHATLLRVLHSHIPHPVLDVGVDGVGNELLVRGWDGKNTELAEYSRLRVGATAGGEGARRRGRHVVLKQGAQWQWDESGGPEVVRRRTGYCAKVVEVGQTAGHRRGAQQGRRERAGTVLNHDSIGRIRSPREPGLLV